MTQLSAERTFQSVAAPVAPVTPPLAHPTACPSWCKSRSDQMGHRFGPTGTFHWSPQYAVGNPRPWAEGDDIIMTAELVVSDEDDQVGKTSLYIVGASDIDLSEPEADIFIANMQAFVDTLKVLRGQMSAGRIERQRPDFAAV